MSVRPLSLSGGIFLSASEYKSGMNADHAHISELQKKHGLAPTNLGIIEYFINSGFLETQGSLFTLPGEGTPIDVQGTVYTWETPLAIDEFYIVEDLSDSETPGIDEQTFKLRFNRRAVSNGVTITPSPYIDLQLFVTTDEILQDGKTWVYTVQVVGQNAKNRWFDKKFLVPGTRFAQSSSFFGEWSTITQDLEWSSKMAKFYNYVGATRAAINYTVSDEAAHMHVPDGELVSIKNYQKVLNMYQMKPGTEGFEYQIQGGASTGFGEMLTNAYKGDVKALRKDILLYSWVPEVEALALRRLELDVLNEKFWGTGGTITLEGRTYNRPIGLYPQMNMGNIHSYNISTFTLGFLDGLLSSYFSGRMRFDTTNNINITTGDGGMNMIYRLTQNLPSSHGMVTQSADYLSGDTRNLHFKTPRITSFDFSFGTITFSLNPALNPRKGVNDFTNPLIGAYRLSSYMMFLTDITNGADNNVYTLRNIENWDTKWQFENGKYNYMGNLNGFQGRLDVPWGFKVRMEKRHQSLMLKDPTKAFILKPINPNNGLPFGDL